jgi:hypothetical protein
MIDMARPEKLTRVELKEVNGHAHMDVYVDARDDVKVGAILDLDDVACLWEILVVHETVDRTSIKRLWNNNI